MIQGLTGWHLLLVLAVILLLFGAAKLPALAKSVGQSARLFKGEIDEMKREDQEERPGNAASSASRIDPPSRGTGTPPTS